MESRVHGRAIEPVILSIGIVQNVERAVSSSASLIQFETQIETYNWLVYISMTSLEFLYPLKYLSHMDNSKKGSEVGNEDWCPITATSRLIGKKWHPAIIHRLLQCGPLGFSELLEQIDEISNKVLSDSLDDLENNEIINREVISQKPLRVDYSLTDFGRSLEPVIRAMEEWGRTSLRSKKQTCDG